MDFQKLFDSLANENSPRKSYVYLETILLKILEREAEKQGKELITNYVKKSNKKDMWEYDAVAPAGLFNINEPIVFELKIYRKKESLSLLASSFRALDNLLIRNQDFSTVIYIISLHMTEEEKQLIINKFPPNNKNIIIWSIEDINEIISKNSDYYEEISNNISELALNKNITDVLKTKKNDWKETRNFLISELSEKFKNDDLVLMLGAGVSIDAGIPTWDKLVSELLVSLLEVKLEENDISIGDDERKLIIDALKKENSSSPLLQTRYIRTGLNKNFYSVLNKVLYRNCKNSSELLKSLAKLCQPLRNRIGIKAIINYNFDDLMETNLRTIEVENKPIFRETDLPSNESLSIFHVHGFLPRATENHEELEESLFVFSEEGYHSVMLDPYHWSNLVQLNYLRENTCLLIGMSMTDPNLRRLLDIAMRKRSNGESRHYVVLKRNDLSIKAKSPNSKENRSISKFNSVNYSLQEEVLKELGLKVIWVEDYSEIPGIMKKVRK